MADAREDEIDRRVAQVGGVYVHTPEIKEAVALIERTRKLRRQNGTAYCSLITGASGTGKSRIFELYRQREPAPADDNLLPVLMFSVPSPFSPVALVHAVLNGLGVESFAGRQELPAMLDRTRLYLERRKVELILMEEASGIVDRKERTAKIPYWATDAIKLHFLELARVPVVMNGIPVARQLFAINPQLETRRCGTIELKPYDMADPLSRNRFVLLAEMFERQAGFPKAYLAADGNLCARLHRATGGIHAMMAKLLTTATDIGIRKGADGFTASVLAEALARIADPEKGWVNPFLVDVLPQVAGSDDTRVTALTKRASKGGKEIVECA